MAKVSSVEEYRKERAKEFVIKVPSGAVFRIKKLSPMDFIDEGLKDIPNEFFEFILQVEQSGMIGPHIEGKDKENLELFAEFLRITVEKGVLDPPVMLEYKDEKKDTHLLYSELEKEDQECLAKAIMGKSFEESGAVLQE